MACGIDSDQNSSFSVRVTREEFAEFTSILLIPEENIEIDLEEVFFSNFDLATGSLDYDEIFSTQNPKFEPDIFNEMKKAQEPFSNKIEEKSGVTSVTLSNSGAKANSPPSNMRLPEINPDVFNKKLKQAVSLVKLQGSSSQLDHIMSELDKISGNDPVRLSNLAKLYMKSGNIEKACEILEHAEKISPNDYKILYTHAICLYKGDKLDLAEQKLQEVVKLNPDFLYAYYNLGNIYYKNKNYHEALDYFKKSMDIAPEMPNIYFNIGLTLEQLNHNEFAKKFYQKCLEINSNDREAAKALNRLR